MTLVYKNSIMLCNSIVRTIRAVVSGTLSITFY